MMIFNISEIDTEIGFEINLCTDHKIISRSISVLISMLNFRDGYRDSLIGLLSKLACPLTPQDHMITKAWRDLAHQKLT